MLLSTASVQAQSTVWSTSFDCADWDHRKGLSDAAVCASGDGIAGAGAWSTSGHPNGDEITDEANRPGSAGKGLRHYRNGYNGNGGGLYIQFPKPLSDFCIDWHMRYQQGFTWTAGYPAGTKEIYLDAGTQHAIYVGFGFGNWRFIANGRGDASSTSWASIMGGATGDGKWHQYSACFKGDTNGTDGVGILTIDGREVFKRTNVNLGRGPWNGFVLGSNQDSSAGEQYTDYDDVEVTTGSTAPPPPPPPPPAPLSLACPADQSIAVAYDQVGGPVLFPAPVAAGGVAPVMVTTAPDSGSVFLLGTTAVTATAVDSAGDRASCGLTVTVTAAQPPPPPPPPPAGTTKVIVEIVDGVLVVTPQ